MDRRAENFKILTGDRIADKLQLEKNFKSETSFESLSPILTRQNSKRKFQGKVAELNSLSKKVAEDARVSFEDNDIVNIGEKSPSPGLREIKPHVTDLQP